MAELTDAWRQRLIDRMAALGLSSADVTRRAGVNPTMVHDIICETIDGDRLVKVLTAGAGPLAFNLRSYDPRRPDIQNAAWLGRPRFNSSCAAGSRTRRRN